MKNKIICILVMTLLIATTVLPVVGNISNDKIQMVICKDKYCSGLIGPPPSEEWNKIFNKVVPPDRGVAEGYSVQQTNDGGYIVTGYLNFGAGGKDVWLIKTDENGNEIWNKTFGGNDEDIGYSVIEASGGGYFVAGATKSFGAGGYDVWLIKTDIDGDKLWDKTFGGQDNDFGYSLCQDANKFIVITGETLSYTIGGFPDVWVIKTDKDGNEQWNNAYGGKSNDYGFSVQQTNDGKYIVAGMTSSYGAGGNDVWLLKIKSNGICEWDKEFGGGLDDLGSSVEQTNDGGFIVTGYTQSYGAGSADMWLIKTDSSGGKVWDKTFGGINHEWGHSVQQTCDNGYIITGRTESFGNGGSDVWLIKTDENGNEQWTKTFGIQYIDNGNSVQQTSDGGYIITGDINQFGGCSTHDLWLIKVCCYPTIQIVKPTPGLYINNNFITPLSVPLIIGDISIEATPSSPCCAITTVTFQIIDHNGNAIKTVDDNSAPYAMEWDTCAFGKYTIKVIATNKCDDIASDEITVWKFF